jgi:hypothetical protein
MPGETVRLMVGLLILKQVYKLADETVMAEWVANPYYQYFCGEKKNKDDSGPPGAGDKEKAGRGKPRQTSGTDRDL